MATVVLVRHATTAATGTRLGGWTPGVDLDEAGRAQAEATAARLVDLPVEAVYSSPLERTMQTAAAIARHHNLEVLVDRALGEVDYGSWTNRPLDELRREPMWPVIQTTPSRVGFPDGETIRAAQARAVDAVESLAARHTGVVVAVSHADVIKAVVASLIGMPLDAFQRLVVSPASITVLHLAQASAPLLLRFNDTGAIEPPPPMPGTGESGPDAEAAHTDTSHAGEPEAGA